MAQYFENDPTLQEKDISYSFSFNGKEFTLRSANGIFSADKLDTGTRILLETVLEEQTPPANLLDLGCGIGVVGVVLGSFWHCPVTCVDVNIRACELARENLQAADVQGTVVCQDGIHTGEYECILLNPPIRAGKKVIYSLFEQALDHLASEGSFWIVIRKQHGAASAIKFLQEQGANAKRVTRDKGFWVLKITRSKIS